MKTLLIFGSPRRHGNTAALVDELKNHVRGELVTIDTYRDDVHPCIHCGHCEKEPACSIKDGMQRVYEILPEADNIILAAPVFFSELPGPVFNLLSRLQVYYVENRFEKLSAKRGLLLLTAGGDAPAKPALQSGRRILAIMRAREREMVLSLKTNSLPSAEDRQALREVAEKARWLYE